MTFRSLLCVQSPSRALALGLCALQFSAWPVAVQAQQVYRCPGNLYTDALSQREAAEKGCKTLEGAPVTIIQATPRPAPRPATASGGGSERPPASDDAKAKDADARRILEAELRKEEEALASLRKEFNNGEPERRGDERNAQKYLDRIKEMKDAITRKEADIASIKRELAKLSGTPSAGANK
jgi:hypothetical protein